MILRTFEVVVSISHAQESYFDGKQMKVKVEVVPFETLAPTLPSHHFMKTFSSSSCFGTHGTLFPSSLLSRTHCLYLHWMWSVVFLALQASGELRHFAFCCSGRTASASAGFNQVQAWFLPPCCCSLAAPSFLLTPSSPAQLLLQNIVSHIHTEKETALPFVYLLSIFQLMKSFQRRLPNITYYTYCNIWPTQHIWHGGSSK